MDRLEIAVRFMHGWITTWGEYPFPDPKSHADLARDCFMLADAFIREATSAGHNPQQDHAVRPLESRMVAGHSGPNAVLGTSACGGTGEDKALEHHCCECTYFSPGSAHNSECTHPRMGMWVCFEEGIDGEMCCDHYAATKVQADL